MAARRIFITGATGFIGRYLMQYFMDAGDEVLGSSTSAQNSDHLVQLDLLDAKGVVDVIKRFSPTHIVHLGAIASVGYSDLATLYAVNVVGTQNLLEAIRQYDNNIVRVVLASTAGVYGNQSEEFLHEELPFNPANHYSISKVSMELLSRQYRQDFSISIIRLFNVIGIGQNPSFLIPKLTTLFAKRVEEIEVGNISSVRDYIDVNTCVRVIDKLLDSEKVPEIMNLCSGIGVSGEEIIEKLISITDHTPIIKRLDTLSRRSEVWRLVGSTEKMHDTLDCQVDAFITINDTLRGMVDHFNAK